MPRMTRVNEDIQRTLAALLPSLKDPRIHGVVSVTRVDTTPDLKQCKVYVSVLEEESAAEVLKGVRSASGFLRREVGRVLTLRNTPELSFHLDESIREGAHILELLHDIEKEGTAYDEPDDA